MFNLEFYRAATVHVPKPPPNRSAKAVAQRRELRQHEAKVRDIQEYHNHLFTVCLFNKIEISKTRSIVSACQS